MRDIDLTSSKGATRTFSVFTYGGPGSGKTRFAATWPKPLMLFQSDRGWETIRNMDPSLFWEPEFMPIAKALDSALDMAKFVPEIEKLAATGQIETVVMDGFNYYCEAYLAHVERTVQAKDPRQHWSHLYTHMRWLMQTLNRLPINVIYTALSADDDGRKTVLLPNKEKEAAPGRCDYHFFQRVAPGGKDQPPIYELWTRMSDDGWPARSRDEGKLPGVLPEVSYRSLSQAIGAPNSAHTGNGNGPVVEQRVGNRTVARPQ